MKEPDKLLENNIDERIKNKICRRTGFKASLGDKLPNDPQPPKGGFKLDEIVNRMKEPDKLLENNIDERIKNKICRSTGFKAITWGMTPNPPWGL